MYFSSVLVTIVTGLVLVGCATQPEEDHVTKRLSDDEIVRILSVENHLTNVAAASIVDGPERVRYMLQRAAITQAGERQLVRTVTNLIWYLDYPQDAAKAGSFHLSGPSLGQMRQEWCA